MPTLIEQLTNDPTWTSLRAAGRFLSRLEKLTLARFLMGKIPAQRADFAVRSVRVAWAGDASTDNLAEPLALRLLERGMFGVQYHAPFAQIAQEVRDPTSGLHLHKADVIVLSPVSACWSRIAGTTAADAEQLVNEAWSHITALRERFDGLILVQNLTDTEARPMGILDSRADMGRVDFARWVNLELARRCRETAQVFVLDAQFLAHLSGSSWPTLHKQNLMASRPVTDDLASLIAADVAAFCAALKGFARKVLVLDLDNTLWGGVVGEDGVAGLRIGGAYPGNLHTELQRVIRSLRERGVVLAIVSKNNEADAWEVFAQRPEMVLQRADFSAHRINWTDKVQNIREIAAELNLGLDAFVMMDDNPVERAWIEEALPEVEVCPASDPMEMLRWLTTSRLFDTLSATREDALRGASYAAAEERSRAAAKAGGLEDYLATLGTEITVGLLTSSQLARVAQLTQKTNQFNLTTRRYTEAQVAAMMNSADWRVFWCSCRDRFADEGIIGAALVRADGEAWHMDTFLMSCRVLGRGVEKAFLHTICNAAAKENATTVSGEFIRSAKNTQTENFYSDCGFTATESSPEQIAFALRLPAADRLCPAWIKVNAAD